MVWAEEFRLAHELRQPLHRLLGWSGPMTHRQLACWKLWLREEWNQPDRGDWYLMQCTAMQSAKENVKVDDFRIKFSSSQESMAVKSEPVFVHEGKPFGPRRLTKADVIKLEQQHKLMQIAQAAGKTMT